MKKRIPVVMAVILALAAAPGLSEDRFQAGLNFNLGFPRAEFKENLESRAYGGEGYFMYRLPHTPVYVGLSAGLLVYGSEAWTEEFSPNFPEILVDVRTRNYILQAHIVLRVQPGGDFRPYVEGLYGINHLWTATSLHDADSWGEEEFARAVNFSDTTTSYGAGAGIQFTLLKALRSNGARVFAIEAELGARYLAGGRAEYLREGSIIRENGEVTYDVLESSTPLISARAGVCFRF